MRKTNILIVEDNSIIALQTKVISATFESDKPVLFPHG